MYIVVETVEAGKKLSSAVPNNWVNNNILFWPQHLKGAELVNAIKTKQATGVDWAELPCRILYKDIEQYKDALKKENSAQYFSNSEEESNHCLKQQRIQTQDFNKILESEVVNTQEFIETQYELESESEINTNIFRKILPGMRVPITSTQVNRSASSITKQAESNAHLSPNDHLRPFSKSKEQINQCDCCKQVLKEFEVLKKDNKDIKAMLSLCMKKINSIGNTDSDDENEISLPISSLDDLNELNNQCKQPAFANKLIKQLSFYHLSEEKSALRKLLQEIASDIVFLNISWKGTVDKTSFVNLTDLNNVLIKTIKKTFKSYSSATFES